MQKGATYMSKHMVEATNNWLLKINIKTSPTNDRQLQLTPGKETRLHSY